MRLDGRCLLAPFILCAATWAQADEQQDWMMAREAEFIRFQRANPNSDAAITDLKAKTAALVAAAGAPVTDVATVPTVRRVPGAVTQIWDSPVAPQMVVIPAGSFTLGSPASEKGRVGNEGPQRRININTPFAVGKYPVTRDEYAAFVEETKRPDGATCYIPGNSGGFTLGTGFQQVVGATWRNPGFPQTGRDPAVCVSWSDAQAYITWLSKKTGKHYRLLSEAEFEYSTRAGTSTARYWGDAPDRNAANYGGEVVGGIAAGIAAGADRWIYTSPVGSFPANPFGLYDMTGNVLQWVQDCYQTNYAVPADGSALDCTTRATRGTAWTHQPNFARSAYRGTVYAQNRSSTAGFRVARSL